MGFYGILWDLPSGNDSHICGKIHHVKHGKIHYFDWAIFQFAMLNYRRVTIWTLEFDEHVHVHVSNFSHEKRSRCPDVSLKWFLRRKLPTKSTCFETFGDHMDPQHHGRMQSSVGCWLGHLSGDDRCACLLFWRPKKAFTITTAMTVGINLI